jgi:hypothetical protein
MIGFEYPEQAHVRRHGPAGYKDYNSYRDWLRDEFVFRCVYCLHREQWYDRGATFHIDHFIPVAIDPGGKCEYSNLLYSCASCNEAKKAIIGVPDPCKVAFRECIRIRADGHVEALNRDGEKLVLTLLLDSPRNVSYRSRWMQTLETLATSNPPLFRAFMGFPDDLPDLRTRQAPQNTRPEGTMNCHFALRERGELPAIY